MIRSPVTAPLRPALHPALGPPGSATPLYSDGTPARDLADDANYYGEAITVAAIDQLHRVLHVPRYRATAADLWADAAQYGETTTVAAIRSLHIVIHTTPLTAQW